MNKPLCLHIPALIAGRPANICWPVVSGAEGYILERKTNQDEFTAIYYGLGNQEFLAHKSKTWLELDTEARTWADIDRDQKTWKEIENQTEHVGFTDRVPSDASWVQYRVKAVSATSESEWLESPEVAVQQSEGYYDTATISLTKGTSYFKTVTGEEIVALGGEMEINYTPSELEIVSCIAKKNDHIFQSETDVAGSIRIICDKDIPSEKMWSGPVILIEFRALVSGETVIHLM